MKKRNICVAIRRIILKYGYRWKCQLPAAQFPRAIFCDPSIHRGPQVKLTQGEENLIERRTSIKHT